VLYLNALKTLRVEALYKSTTFTFTVLGGEIREISSKTYRS